MAASRRDVPSVPVSVLQGTNSLRGVYHSTHPGHKSLPSAQGSGGRLVAPGELTRRDVTQSGAQRFRRPQKPVWPSPGSVIRSHRCRNFHIKDHPVDVPHQTSLTRYRAAGAERCSKRERPRQWRSPNSRFTVGDLRDITCESEGCALRLCRGAWQSRRKQAWLRVVRGVE